jgi:hypothetical protein
MFVEDTNRERSLMEPGLLVEYVSVGGNLTAKLSPLQ